MGLDQINPSLLVAQIVILFLGIGLHEYAHCKFADMAGDPTPRFYGRVTLNLTKHFEPIGTAMMVISSIMGVGIGWGRPAPADPRKMRNPRWDFFVSVAAGPISNLVQAAIYGFLFRLAIQTQIYEQFPSNFYGDFFRFLLPFGLFINLRLFLFNLIPFGPLDGHWLIGLLLPERQRIQWFKINNQIGMMGLLVAVFVLQSMHIQLLMGPTAYFFNLLSGQNFNDLFQ